MRFSAFLPLQKFIWPDSRIEADIRTAYLNFYSLSFAQPLSEAQRFEAMNAKIYNDNEKALTSVLYST